MISKYWKLTDKVLSLSHENFNTQIYKTLKIVKNRRKFVNNYKKTSEKKHYLVDLITTVVCLVVKVHFTTTIDILRQQ